MTENLIDIIKDHQGDDNTQEETEQIDENYVSEATQETSVEANDNLTNQTEVQINNSNEPEFDIKLIDFSSWYRKQYIDGMSNYENFENINNVELRLEGVDTNKVIAFTTKCESDDAEADAVDDPVEDEEPVEDSTEQEIEETPSVDLPSTDQVIRETEKVLRDIKRLVD